MFTFSPITKAKSAEVNSNFQGLANGAEDTAGNSIYIYRAESNANFVYSGLVWSLVSGLNGTMTSGTVYVSGIRLSIATITSRTYTASKDTYVDIDSDGVIYYTEVANNVASPALPANRIRIAIIVTSGVAITVFNQGQVNTTAPTVSGVILSVSDNLGNLIYNQSPIPTLLGLRRTKTSGTTSSTTPAEIGGTTLPIIIPNGARRKVRLSVKARAAIVSNAGDYIRLTWWNGAVGSGTEIRRLFHGTGTAGQHTNPDHSFIVEITGSATLRFAMNSELGGPCTYQAGTVGDAEVIEFTAELV